MFASWTYRVYYVLVFRCIHVHQRVYELMKNDIHNTNENNMTCLCNAVFGSLAHYRRM